MRIQISYTNQDWIGVVGGSRELQQDHAEAIFQEAPGRPIEDGPDNGAPFVVMDLIDGDKIIQTKEISLDYAAGLLGISADAVRDQAEQNVRAIHEKVRQMLRKVPATEITPAIPCDNTE